MKRTRQSQIFLIVGMLMLAFVSLKIKIFSANVSVAPPLSCTVKTYKVTRPTLPYPDDGLILANNSTLHPGDMIIYSLHIDNNTGKDRVTLRRVYMTQVAGSDEPIEIQGSYTPNGNCTVSPDKRISCFLNYSFAQTGDNPVEFLFRVVGSSVQPKTSSLFSIETDAGTTACTSWFWVKGKAPEGTPTPTRINEATTSSPVSENSKEPLQVFEQNVRNLQAEVREQRERQNVQEMRQNRIEQIIESIRIFFLRLFRISL